MEIERKFLPQDKKYVDFKYSNEFNGINGILINQAYVSYGNPEVRIRQEKVRGYNEFTVTIKTPVSDVERKEVVIGIAESHFYYMAQNMVISNWINKMRTPICLPNKKYKSADVDEYLGEYDAHEGLVVIEVEFYSLQQAEEFSPPEWFGLEVTGNPLYKNANLAKKKECVK